MVALIAAVARLATSVWTLRRQERSSRELATLQHDLTNKAKAEERQVAAKEQLDKSREPLLAAAEDLRARLWNIRNGGFLVYLHSADEHRRRVALLSSLYRLGKYWAIVEGLYSTVNSLRFETEDETKEVAGLLKEIETVFAADYVDGHRLMVWREEQRAIAELMRPNGTVEPLAVVGFASFVSGYPTRFETWFSRLEADLQRTGIEGSKRLQELERLLDQLVQKLEAGR